MPGSRSARAVIVVGVVLAAVLVPTVLALALTRDDGATTPEGAVHQLADAVASGDVRAVWAALPPGEREALVPSVAALVPELQRLGLLDAFDGVLVPGATIRIEGLDVRTEGLDDLYEEIAAVDVVGGTLSGTLDPGATPLSGAGLDVLRRDFGVGDAEGPVTFRRDFAVDPLHLIAIHEGGGWHVSVLYSVADALRLEHDVPFPKIGEGPDAAGADTPEQAAGDLFRAWADSEAGRAVALMNPVEARSLYDYAPLFLLPSQRSGRLADDEGSYDAQLNRVAFRFEGSGGVRRATVTALDADLRGLVTKTHVTYDGRCFRQDERFADDLDPFVDSVACANDAAGRDASAARPRTNPFSVLAVFGEGEALPTLTIVERNGRWFIDPIRTVLDSLVDALRVMDPQDVDRFAQGVDASIEAAGRWARGQDSEPGLADAAARITAAEAGSASGATRRIFEACTRAALAHEPDAVTGSTLDATQAARRAQCLGAQVALGRVDPADLATAAPGAAGPT